jgi:hypothetical protein
MTPNKVPRIIDGFTENAWVSLAVKSLRMGWPEGLAQARARVCKSKIASTITCGTFEDIFPPRSELTTVLMEIKIEDFNSLCARETHHGRMLTNQFCSLEHRAVEAAKDFRQKALMSKIAINDFRMWLPPRSFNCFWTWLEIKPEDYGIRREVDRTPWTGMPEAMLDLHTPEGRNSHRFVTILSGTYKQHHAIGQIVMKEGWGRIRDEVHSGKIYPVKVEEEQEALWQ